MVQIDHSFPVRSLAAEACRIVAEVRRVDVRLVEDDASGAARKRLVESIHGWLGDAAALLTSAEQTFATGEPEEDGVPPTPERFIADVAAMAAVAIAEKRRLIDRVGEDAEPWDVIDRCDRALRAMTKNLAALENALAELEGVAPLLALDDELDKGLRIRRLYEKFRLAIREHLASGEKPLLARIRAAGTAIAILTGREEYGLMRVGDRILIRKIQGRILQWVSSSRDAAEGARLCDEIVAVAELLMGISSRAELVEYDRSKTDSAAPAAAIHSSTTNNEGERDGKNR